MHPAVWLFLFLLATTFIQFTTVSHAIPTKEFPLYEMFGWYKTFALLVLIFIGFLLYRRNQAVPSINCLPDEMIGMIMQHLDYKTAYAMRQVNSRFDRIGKVYDLGTRLPVEELWLSLEQKSNGCRFCSVWFGYNPDFPSDLPKQKNRKNRSKEMYSYTINITESYEQLQEFFKKVQVFGKISIDNYSINVDDRFLQCLCTQKKMLRSLSSYWMYVYPRGQVSWTKPGISRFFECCPKLTNFWTRNADSKLFPLLDVELFGGRCWSNVSLLRAFPEGSEPETLTKAFIESLVNLQIKELKLSWGLTIEFDVNWLLQFVQKCLKDKVITDQQWTFPNIPHGNLTWADFARILEGIDGIEYAVINNSFEIYFRVFPDAKIKFDCREFGANDEHSDDDEEWTESDEEGLFSDEN